MNLLCTLLLPASVENKPRKGGEEESSEGTVYGASETSQDESTASRC